VTLDLSQYKHNIQSPLASLSPWAYLFELSLNHQLNLHPSTRQLSTMTFRQILAKNIRTAGILPPRKLSKVYRVPLGFFQSLWLPL